MAPADATGSSVLERRGVSGRMSSSRGNVFGAADLSLFRIECVSVLIREGGIETKRMEYLSCHICRRQEFGIVELVFQIYAYMYVFICECIYAHGPTP